MNYLYVESLAKQHSLDESDVKGLENFLENEKITDLDPYHQYILLKICFRENSTPELREMAVEPTKEFLNNGNLFKIDPYHQYIFIKICFGENSTEELRSIASETMKEFLNNGNLFKIDPYHQYIFIKSALDNKSLNFDTSTQTALVIASLKLEKSFGDEVIAKTSKSLFNQNEELQKAIFFAWVKNNHYAIWDKYLPDNWELKINHYQSVDYLQCDGEKILSTSYFYNSNDYFYTS